MQEDKHEHRHARMRRLFARGAGLILPGAFNALAARIIEMAGHEVVFVTGAGVANGYLGAPDLGLLTVTELAGHVSAMATAVEVPLFVDADTGFGNALNVRRTVQLLEQAGASAIVMEDQTFPKRCGHFDGKQVIPIDEMVGKIKAAVDARRDDRLMIVARTDARAVEGYAAAIARANAYRDAGADGLFVEAPLSAEELLAIPTDAPGLHMCNMVFGGKTPLLSRARLAQAGYAGICYANVALQSAIHSMQQAMVHLRDTGSAEGMEHLLVSFQERQRVLRGDAFKQLEERYK
jgi:2-methylisocitrate lyase-like PEP mutase family enzyme